METMREMVGAQRYLATLGGIKLFSMAADSTFRAGCRQFETAPFENQSFRASRLSLITAAGK
jgi:hypothetical protein